MSFINQLRSEAYEKAFWYFAQQDYLTAECEFLANKFAAFRLENLETTNLEDLLNEFVGDVVFAEAAEADKERSLHA